MDFLFERANILSEKPARKLAKKLRKKNVQDKPITFVQTVFCFTLLRSKTIISDEYNHQQTKLHFLIPLVYSSDSITGTQSICEHCRCTSLSVSLS